MIDNPVDRFDTNRIASAVKLRYKQSSPSDLTVMSLSLGVSSLVKEVASKALTLGSIDWDRVYEPMPFKQDEISIVIMLSSESCEQYTRPFIICQCLGE